MPLKPCPACGKEVSPSAAFCIHCGAAICSAIFTMKGVQDVLEVFEDRVTIKPQGVLGFLTKGLKGTKEIPFSSIVAVQFKEAGGVFSGYLQFTIPGGNESKGGLLSASKDENTFMFAGVANNAPALEIKAYITGRLRTLRTPQTAAVPTAGIADEIQKLVVLKQQGILTDEEFQSGKRKLIGVGAEPPSSTTAQSVPVRPADVLRVAQEGAVTSSLTPEERHRIHPEEKGRIDVEAQVERDEEGATNHQRAFSQKRAAIWCVGIIGIFVLFGMLASTLQRYPTNRSASEVAAAERPPAPDPFDSMSARQHLEMASKLAVGNSDEVDAAVRHIKAIPQNGPEQKDAAKLLVRALARRDELVAIREKEREAKYIEEHPLEVVSSNWSAGGFGSVGLWTVTFKNVSSKPVGNIKYRTVYYSETGGELGRGGVDSVFSPGTIERVIPAKKSRTIEVNDGFINSQAHRARFEIVSWEFVRDAR
jgi:hypothetical protein